jgi:PKD repeat protein
VILRRERGGHASDRITLTRRRAGVYSGSGVFYQALACNGRRYPHGGRVPFSITVRVTRAHRVQSTLFATSLSATYVNRSRRNNTRCSGFLGHDAARYSGRLRGSPPTAPTANFTFTADDPVAQRYSFQDTTRRGRGGARVTRRSWNFGDPDSGSENTSTSATPHHTFSSAPPHKVRLNVRDANGLTSGITKTVPGTSP